MKANFARSGSCLLDAEYTKRQIKKAKIEVKSLCMGFYKRKIDNAEKMTMQRMQSQLSHSIDFGWDRLVSWQAAKGCELTRASLVLWARLCYTVAIDYNKGECNTSV
jgi:hypothetical protein